MKETVPETYPSHIRVWKCEKGKLGQLALNSGIRFNKSTTGCDCAASKVFVERMMHIGVNVKLAFEFKATNIIQRCRKTQIRMPTRAELEVLIHRSVIIFLQSPAYFLHNLSQFGKIPVHLLPSFLNLHLSFLAAFLNFLAAFLNLHLSFLAAFFQFFL